MKRLLIILIVLTLLMILLGVIFIHKWGVKRAGPSNTEIELNEILGERQKMLKEAIFQQNNIRR